MFRGSLAGTDLINGLPATVGGICIRIDVIR